MCGSELDNISLAFGQIADFIDPTSVWIRMKMVQWMLNVLLAGVNKYILLLQCCN